MRRLLRLLPHRAGATDGSGSTGATRAPAAARAPDAADAPDAASSMAAHHRAERRAVARRLHPDLGGDVEQYLAALAEVDRRYGPVPDGGPAGARVAGSSARRSRRSGLRRRMNRAARATRQRLPRRAPGARRYAHL